MPLWIGLRRVGVDWAWTDGSPFDYNNFNPEFLRGDDYVYMWVDEWANDNCSSERPFVCRFRSDDGDCPNPWIEEDSNCYLLVETSFEFQAAVEYCEETDPPSTLFTLDEEMDYDNVVVNIFNKEGRMNIVEFWIGYQRDDTLAWDWIANSTSTSNVENWSAGFPQNDTGKDCAYAFPNTWDDYPNSHQFSFACKKPLF